MKAGRKPKAGVLRDQKGKSRGLPQAIHPETLARRERELAEDGIVLTFTKMENGRSVDKRTAEDRLSGFTLGKLLLRGRADPKDPSGISQAQFDAGEKWLGVLVRHSAIMGYELKANVASPAFVSVSSGDWLYRKNYNETMSPEEEIEEADKIESVKKKFKATYKKLMEACVTDGIRVRDVTYGVVVEDWPMRQLQGLDYGVLRIGLNAIGKVL